MFEEELRRIRRQQDDDRGFYRHPNDGNFRGRGKYKRGFFPRLKGPPFGHRYTDCNEERYCPDDRTGDHSTESQSESGFDNLHRSRSISPPHPRKQQEKDWRYERERRHRDYDHYTPSTNTGHDRLDYHSRSQRNKIIPTSTATSSRQSSQERDYRNRSIVLSSTGQRL